MCFPSMPESIGDLETGDAGGIHPVNVWLGYAAPKRIAALACEDFCDHSFDRFSLRRCDISRGFDKFRKLSVCDVVLVDPESLDPHPMCRALVGKTANIVSSPS